ncbi:MAG: hypothetical protein ABI596_14575 [Pyrinomonadaceae bacterium]
MKRKLFSLGLLMATLTLTTLRLTTLAQSCGPYNLSQNVIASGGGSSAGGQFTVAGTVGQPAAGTLLANPPFSQAGGFWQTDLSLPTAASVRQCDVLTANLQSGFRVEGVFRLPQARPRSSWLRLLAGRLE